MPLHDKHAVSVSMPTWDSIWIWRERQSWAMDVLQSCYPRFYLHQTVQNLTDAVSARLSLSDQTTCLIFPSSDASRRLIATLAAKYPDQSFCSVQFSLPESKDIEAQWLAFSVAILPQSCLSSAMDFWAIFGDGISSRHAECSLVALPSMTSHSNNTRFETSPFLKFISQRIPPGIVEKRSIKQLISHFVTSEKPDHRPVTTNDVFLYPKGMCAIAAVIRALIPTDSTNSEAVLYGWPYAETLHCVEASGYNRYTWLSQSNEEELNNLEASLQAGNKIRVLFCELPSNPQLKSPNLPRIHALARRYGFIIACDETIASFVNVDVLPYADVVITSLTKIFSGVCNVMGGSVVVNPNSPHYHEIHSAVTSIYEDLLFPLDAIVLANNATNFEQRVHQSNSNALTMATLLEAHPLVDKVYYPSMVPSRVFYDQVKRRNGGYGCMFSIIFHDPDDAIVFYDTLDVSKGPSLGTDFTLAIPYTQLAHLDELDWAEKNGLEKHIVRISAGVEKEKELVDRVQSALREVEGKRKTFCRG
ncbi:hypothetical protein ASPWEDRAFT_37878 [Aspergillus wentii DTO 134E9]|uniref:Cystathionine gamma-synthase n=1 Tax=Aspergillus wentii DTO 134E9 TaxID=1073089 RepID=A0A1L9RMY6_ASPWE|nr:uncharacterized protein ASPWEDRAFT_37878 [Aspergillus wentii DTO 134E9]OJJ36301.1 hypothetical protein ASPWEDRAFT_37878 [Aspergillus wentii DTO 134E9]